MSDGLTQIYAPSASASLSPTRRTLAVRVAALLVVFSGAGIGGGYLWERLWTPTPGVVSDGTWFPSPIEEGLQNTFSTVGWFVVVAAPIGLLVGLLSALVLARAEVLALVVGLVGSALTAWLILTVGERLSPPDPALAAPEALDGVMLPGTLDFQGWTPLLILPASALLMLAVVFFLIPSHADHPGNSWD